MTSCISSVATVCTISISKSKEVAPPPQQQSQQQQPLATATRIISAKPRTSSRSSKSSTTATTIGSSRTSRTCRTVVKSFSGIKAERRVVGFSVSEENSSSETTAASPLCDNTCSDGTIESSSMSLDVSLHLKTHSSSSSRSSATRHLYEYVLMRDAAPLTSNSKRISNCSTLATPASVVVRNNDGTEGIGAISIKTSLTTPCLNDDLARSGYLVTPPLTPAVKRWIEDRINKENSIKEDALLAA